MPQTLEERMTEAASRFVDGVIVGAGSNASSVIRAAVAAIHAEVERRGLGAPATLTPERRKWIIDRLVAYDLYQAQRMISPQDSEGFWQWVAATLRDHRPYNNLSDDALAGTCEFMGLDRRS